MTKKKGGGGKFQMYVESFSSLKHSFNIVEECNVDM